MVCYRIVEEKNGKLKTLFHGINRSRVIPPNKWLKAEKKCVSDGGTKYLSGFHVLKTRKECEKYLGRFDKTKRKLKIIEVLVKGLRRKKHSNSRVFLASWMKVKS